MNSRRSIGTFVCLNRVPDGNGLGRVISSAASPYPRHNQGATGLYRLSHLGRVASRWLDDLAASTSKRLPLTATPRGFQRTRSPRQASTVD